MLSALLAALAIALPLVEFTLKVTPISDMYSILAGLVIIFIGYSTAYVANRTISENWSPTIDKTQVQKLVSSGVYEEYIAYQKRSKAILPWILLGES